MGDTEKRALLALYRNHPDTKSGDRYNRVALANARARRDVLLAWAASQPDEQLLFCRNLGPVALAWVRANQGGSDLDALRAAVLHAARDVNGLWFPDEDGDGDNDLTFWGPEAGEALRDLRVAIDALDAAEDDMPVRTVTTPLDVVEAAQEVLAADGAVARVESGCDRRWDVALAALDAALDRLEEPTDA